VAQLISVLAVAVVGSLLVAGVEPTTAHADTKSWAALKPHVAAKGLVAGVDLEALRSTPLFTTVVGKVADSKDAQAFFAAAKSECHLDVAASVTDAAVGIDVEHGAGVFALGLGIDRTAFDACFAKVVAKLMPGKVAKITDRGRIVLYKVDSDELPIAWIGPNVIAFKETMFGSPSRKDAEALAAFFDARPSSAMLQASVARANASKPIWFAANGMPKVAELIGNVTVDQGTITLTIRLSALDAREAAEATEEVARKLDRARVKSDVPAARLRVIEAFKVKRTGAKVAIDASISDKDAAAALDVFEKVF